MYGILTKKIKKSERLSCNNIPLLTLRVLTKYSSAGVTLKIINKLSKKLMHVSLFFNIMVKNLKKALKMSRDKAVSIS